MLSGSPNEAYVPYDGRSRRDRARVVVTVEMEHPTHVDTVGDECFCVLPRCWTRRGTFPEQSPARPLYSSGSSMAIREVSLHRSKVLPDHEVGVSTFPNRRRRPWRGQRRRPGWGWPRVSDRRAWAVGVPCTRWCSVLACGVLMVFSFRPRLSRRAHSGLFLAPG